MPGTEGAMPDLCQRSVTRRANAIVPGLYEESGVPDGGGEAAPAAEAAQP